MFNLIINPKYRFYRVEGHIISRSLLSVDVVCFKCLLPKLRAGMRFYDDGYRRTIYSIRQEAKKVLEENNNKQKFRYKSRKEIL